MWCVSCAQTLRLWHKPDPFTRQSTYTNTRQSTYTNTHTRARAHIDSAHACLHLALGSKFATSQKFSWTLLSKLSHQPPLLAVLSALLPFSGCILHIGNITPVRQTNCGSSEQLPLWPLETMAEFDQNNLSVNTNFHFKPYI